MIFNEVHRTIAKDEVTWFDAYVVRNTIAGQPLAVIKILAGGQSIRFSVDTGQLDEIIPVLEAVRKDMDQ